jgi:hypothetical protein
MHFSGATAETDLDVLLGLLSSAVGLAIVSWWLVSMSLAVASALLDAAGRHGASRWARAGAPAFMRRLACATLGMSLLASPAARASSGPADPAWLPVDAVTATSITPRAQSAQPLTAEPVPSPRFDAAWTPPIGGDTSMLPSDGPLLRTELRPMAAHAAGVEVRPGDSLWTIAARHLGPGATATEIAGAWPLWYDANRAAIGSDPHLIRPGTVLVPPRR